MIVETQTLIERKALIDQRWNIFQEELDAQIAELQVEVAALIRTKKRRFDRAQAETVAINQELQQRGIDPATGEPVKAPEPEPEAKKQGNGNKQKKPKADTKKRA